MEKWYHADYVLLCCFCSFWLLCVIHVCHLFLQCLCNFDVCYDAFLPLQHDPFSSAPPSYLVQLKTFCCFFPVVLPSIILFFWTQSLTLSLQMFECVTRVVCAAPMPYRLTFICGWRGPHTLLLKHCVPSNTLPVGTYCTHLSVRHSVVIGTLLSKPSDHKY